VATLLGQLAGNDDLVADPWADLVVASGTPIGLVGFVRLHVADVDTVVGFRPAVRAHATVTVSAAGDRVGPHDETLGMRATWTACASNGTAGW
jgi:hypothetical protein